VNISVPVATAVTLNSPKKMANGAFQFSFTNAPGAQFGVVAVTNPTILPTNWTSLGGAVEIGPGQFQFTDAQAPGIPQRFYRVRSP